MTNGPLPQADGNPRRSQKSPTNGTNPMIAVGISILMMTKICFRGKFVPTMKENGGTTRVGNLPCAMTANGIVMIRHGTMASGVITHEIGAVLRIQSGVILKKLMIILVQINTLPHVANGRLLPMTKNLSTTYGSTLLRILL